MSFKIGDKVKRIAFNHYGMNKGDIGTVKDVNGIHSIKIKEYDNVYVWHASENFELYHRDNNYKLIHNDRVVILIDSKGNKGVAKCDPNDEFDFGFGVELAKARLEGNEELIEKLINDKSKKKTKIQELVGKYAIRTKPVELAFGNDYSYTSTPLKILKATDDHIVTKSNYGNGAHILDHRWVDDNWIEYKSLVNDAEAIKKLTVKLNVDTSELQKAIDNLHKTFENFKSEIII